MKTGIWVSHVTLALSKNWLGAHMKRPPKIRGQNKGAKEPAFPILCPYCNAEAVRCFGKDIYPCSTGFARKRFYRCEPCGAHVGVHEGTWLPFGRLANSELRAARMKAHAAFDPLWKEGHMERSLAYKWLANELSMSFKNAHIGMFDVAQCQLVVEACERQTWRKETA